MPIYTLPSALGQTFTDYWLITPSDDGNGWCLILHHRIESPMESPFVFESPERCAQAIHNFETGISQWDSIAEVPGAKASWQTKKAYDLSLWRRDDVTDILP